MVFRIRQNLESLFQNLGFSVVFGDRKPLVYLVFLPYHVLFDQFSHQMARDFGALPDTAKALDLSGRLPLNCSPSHLFIPIFTFHLQLLLSTFTFHFNVYFSLSDSFCFTRFTRHV